VAARGVAGEGEKRNLGFWVLEVLGFRVWGLVEVEGGGLEKEDD
jgi:hypothetical protein